MLWQLAKRNCVITVGIKVNAAAALSDEIA